jgi:predicted DNA-binding transcriptional regulator YafY
MRADRLVAILLLLQRRGRVTAIEVAEELEVSEKTARRDLEALGAAGIPVYATQGRGGGWHLAGDGKTDLSGLTDSEARALFLVAGPRAGATKEVRAALRKLVRALPEPLRASAEAASTAMMIDPSGWEQRGGVRAEPPFLDAVQRSVIDAQQVRLGYRSREGVETTRIAHPLGVVAKGATWYLIADTDGGRRTFRVDRISTIDATGEPVVRPPGFDLHDAWQLVVDHVELLRAPLVARCSADPDVLPFLRMVFGSRVAFGAPLPDGRIAVELRAQNVRELSVRLAGFGASVDVHYPPELRAELARIGHDLNAAYGSVGSVVRSSTLA